jgi:predicted type IV restriction endonuclease
MPAPAEIKRLVEKFAQHREDYVSGKYNETQVRRDFIDPFLKALGWDVDNSDGASERYREVVHEDRVMVGGESKAPDYSCRLGGNRVFFIEAKKPGVDLKNDPAPAFQLRRYAWSAKLPVSVLTDFDELVIYDTTAKPGTKDKAAVGRLRYWTSSEFIEKWDEIAAILSKEAVKSGGFDKFAGERKRKAVTQVDDDFLEAIEEWRDLLARDLARENTKLDGEELSTAIQRILDRIVFLRICEDRGIEPPGQLHALVNGPHIYGRLKELFTRADQRYNSGLFHFREERGRHESPDTLTPKLKVSDKALKVVLDALYVDAPWAFGVIPADILGSIYERFLGKVIHRDGRGVRIEEKPEVRKAGGVYYTPKYIVDYIVKETVGKLLEGKGPKEAAEVKILDPACGSGSFLIGAYQYLLDWHLDQYLKAPEKHKKQLTEFPKGVWRLTPVERKRILTNSIFGVDIDPQAVEVTKLSLLLKVLEGESAQTLQIAFELMPERALPDLGDNVKCGNSLVGPELLGAGLFGDIDQGELDGLRMFSPHREFKPIFDRTDGGFDVILGNPPYIRIHALIEFHPAQAQFLQEHYQTCQFGKVDVYVAFIERALHLLRPRGRAGYILPNKFFQAEYGVGARRMLTERKAIGGIVDFGAAQVFDDASTYTCLLFLAGSPQMSVSGTFNPEGSAPSTVLESGKWEALGWENFGDAPWALGYKTASVLLSRILANGSAMNSFTSDMITGVKTGANDVFLFTKEGGSRGAVVPEGGGKAVQIEPELLVPLAKAEQLKRYALGEPERFLLYPYRMAGDATRLIPEKEMTARFPKAMAYLEGHRATLEGRQKGKLKGPNWYGLSFSSSLKMFTSPKLVCPTLAPHNAFAFDHGGLFFPQGAGGGIGLVVQDGVDIWALLAVLNSSIMTFVFQMISSRFQGGWYAYEPRFIERLRIAPELVGSVTGVSKRLAALGRRLGDTGDGKRLDPSSAIGVEVSTEIDRLVAEFYGLTSEEHRLIDRSN